MEHSNTVLCFDTSGYEISQNLYGIFLEDINFTCDGGLNANMVNNYSFDGLYFHNQDMHAVSDPLRFWNLTGGTMKSCNEDSLSQHSKFARLTVDGRSVLSNEGYNGLKSHRGKGAMSIQNHGEYEFSCWIRTGDFSGTITAQVDNDLKIALTDCAVLPLQAGQWYHTSVKLTGHESGYGKLVITLKGHGTVDLDCISLMNSETWGKGDSKWKHGRFRKDLVQTLADLHPAFMRFPGGCIVEGILPGNEYNWKDTVGELYDRKSNYCLWAERIEDGGYSQSYQIGFYEYFCLCEDLGMKPLPTLNAGLNCQWRSRKRQESECPNIPLDSDEFQEIVIASYLDLIDFANGDPAENSWAALRADMGHPKPFGLERIGIGNENYGTVYFERFNRIREAIRKKDPTITCVLCAGMHPFWEETSGLDGLDVVWNYANTKHPDVLVDEHSYHTPDWFISEANRFDGYERGGAKVYFGEYAANGLIGDAMRPMNQSNQFDTALGEAAFLTGVERNGDIVEMTSYAPLFNLVDCDQWNHNLINFNPRTVCLSTNYFVQKLFSTNLGKRYLPCEGVLPKGVFLSATADDEKLYIKIVNTTSQTHNLELKLGHSIREASADIFQSNDIHVRNELKFDSDAIYRITPKTQNVSVDSDTIRYQAACCSISVIKASI